MQGNISLGGTRSVRGTSESSRRKGDIWDAWPWGDCDRNREKAPFAASRSNHGMQRGGFRGDERGDDALRAVQFTIEGEVFVPQTFSPEK